MPSTYTTNLGIEKIATGEQSGTWGSTTNTNLDLLDQAVNGVEQVTLAAAGSSGSPNDLPITDGTASDGRNKFIEFIDGGDLGGTAYVQLTPNDAEKIVFLRNSLSASRSVIVFQGTYNASNDFEIPNGKDVVLKFDGAGASATVTQMFVDLKIDALDATTVASTNVNATTVDSTNVEVTNIKAKDGTASATIADSTGVMTIASAVLTTADINGGTADNVTIGGGTAAAGTFTTATATTGNITTVNATTVDTTNIEVTNVKAKDGTASATIADSTGVMTIASSVLTTTDINGGTIDGVTIGGASAGAGTFTTITGSGDMNIDSGTLFVDVSENRVGIGTTSPDVKLVINDPSVAFGTTGSIKINGQQTNQAAGSEISSVIFGSGASSGSAGSKIATVKGSNNQSDSLAFYTGTTTLAERMRLDSSGNVGIGTASPDELLHLAASSGATIRFESTTTGATTGDIFGAIEFETQDASSAGIKAKIDAYSEGGVGNTALRLFTGDTTGLYQRLNIASNGDISFYEDTGTTPKLFWDASEETVSIGASTSTGDPLLIIHNEATVLSTHIASNGSLQGKGSLVNVRNDSSTNGAFAGLEFNTSRSGGTEQRAFIVANAEATGFAPSIVFGQRTASGAIQNASASPAQG
jgi:hypothetical protein